MLNPEPIGLEALQESWLERARAGDDLAFRHLVEAHEARVAAVALGMLGAEEAEDVGQEVFIRLHRHLHQFRGEAQLSTWLTRIAINLCLDRLRVRRRLRARFLRLDEAGEEREPRQDGEALLDSRERARLVRRAVHDLKADWRAVVVLRWLRGMDTEETARLLGIPYGTALSRLSRAMGELRRRLGPLLEMPAVRPGEEER